MLFRSHQTSVDTTQGEPEPMGQRDATMADEVADPPVPSKKDREEAKARA